MEVYFNFTIQSKAQNFNFIFFLIPKINRKIAMIEHSKKQVNLRYFRESKITFDLHNFLKSKILSCNDRCEGTPKNYLIFGNYVN